MELQTTKRVALAFEITHELGHVSHHDSTANSTPVDERTNHVHSTDSTTQYDFPEGGLRAYLTVLGSFMGLIPVFGIYSTVGAIQTYIASNQLSTVDTSTISWIFSLFNFIAYASSIFSGGYFDHSGARVPLGVGSLLFVIGVMASANCSSVWQFVLAFGVVLGCGVGVLTSPLISVISQYFSKKRATYTSIATIGGCVGGIAFPMMLRGLYPTIGYAWSMRSLGFVCLVCFVCSLVLTKERVRKQKPEVEGLTSYLKVNLLDMFDYKGFKEFRYCCVVGAVSLAEVSIIITTIYFPSYVLMRGYSVEKSYLLVTIMNVASIGGRIIPGYLSDKLLGPFNTVIVTNFLAALSMVVVWLPFGEQLGALYAFSVLYGFFSGSIYSLTPVLVGVVSRTEDFGKRYATMYLVTAVAMLVSIPIAGALVGDGTARQYGRFIWMCFGTAMASVLCHCLTRWRLVGLAVGKRV